MDAILYVGHGSRDPQGNEEVRQFVSSIVDQLNVPIVELCFLEFEAPGLLQGMEACIHKGATRIAVIPMMLFAAGHAKIHIPAAIDEAKTKYPHVEFVYGKPIGVNEQVLHILEERLYNAGFRLKDAANHSTAADKDEEWANTALLIIGRGSSDPDANGDLFKMSRLFWERLKIGFVETAFIGVTSPSIEEGVERCLKLGARRIILLPYFLFTGVLIKRLEDLVADYKAEHPHIEFVLAHYFGFHPMLKKVLKERATEALEGEVWMNCANCQYRIEAMEHMDHHHHEHHHGHHHHHSHGHDHHSANAKKDKERV